MADGRVSAQVLPACKDESKREGSGAWRVPDGVLRGWGCSSPLRPTFPGRKPLTARALPLAHQQPRPLLRPFPYPPPCTHACRHKLLYDTVRQELEERGVSNKVFQQLAPLVRRGEGGGGMAACHSA